MPPLTAEPPANPQDRAPEPLRVDVPEAPAMRPQAAAERAPAAGSRPVALVLAGLAAVWLLLVILTGATDLFLPDEEEEANPRVAAAVVVAPIEVGPLVRRRGFSGTLESPAVLEASPQVSGRVATVEVRLGDAVERGEALVRLDPEELEQALLTAEAELAVAAANAAEAVAAEEIAERTVARVRQLREEGLTSDAEADRAEAERLAAAAAVEVAEARRLAAEAGLRTARIRRSHAVVAAKFTGGADTRRVAEVMVQEGDSVSPGDPLVRLVQLDPLRGVFAATQADRARLEADQPVELTTDAYPGRTFPGRIDRLAPAFSARSRQARVEVDVQNPEGLLRPGMFVRLETDLESLESAVSVPRDAVVTRDEQEVVFVLAPGASTVESVPVELGLAAGDRVQVLKPAIEGEVVVLGQQLLQGGDRVNASRRMGEAVPPEVIPEEPAGTGEAA